MASTPNNLRKRELLEKLKWSPSTLYRRLRDPDSGFPAPIPMGSAQMLVWLEPEIEAYLQKQISAARGVEANAGIQAGAA